jgi:hypothetical protein
MLNQLLKTVGPLALGLLTLIPPTPAHASGGQNPFGGGVCGPVVNLPVLTLKLPDLIIRKVILSSNPELAFVLVGNIGTAPSKPCQVIAGNQTGVGLANVPVLYPGKYEWVRVILVNGSYMGCHKYTGFRVDCFQDVPELSETNNTYMIIDNSTC